MLTIVRYTMLTAMRDWLFIGMIALIMMAYGFAIFAGSTALVEQVQTSMAYFAGTSRLILMIGLIVFVSFHVRRAFDNREIESTLSKPISRTEFILAYWASFVILAVMISLPVFILLALSKADMVGLLYWGASMILELSLVVAFTLLAALIMKSAVSAVLSSFAFYLVSRLMGFFDAILTERATVSIPGLWGDIAQFIMKGIAVIVPRLDMYAKSEWLIYGLEKVDDSQVFLLQSLAYIPFLLAMALFDFKRKQF